MLQKEQKMFAKPYVAIYNLAWPWANYCGLVWPFRGLDSWIAFSWSCVAFYGLVAKYGFDLTFMAFSRGHRSKFIWSCFSTEGFSRWFLHSLGWFKNHEPQPSITMKATFISIYRVMLSLSLSFLAVLLLHGRAPAVQLISCYFKFSRFYPTTNHNQATALSANRIPNLTKKHDKGPQIIESCSIRLSTRKEVRNCQKMWVAL